MSDDKIQGPPPARSLDGVLDELRSVLAGASASSQNTPEEVELVAPAPPPPPPPVSDPIVPFEVIIPDAAPPPPPPPIPTAVEQSVDQCSLVERAADPALPPPPVSEGAPLTPALPIEQNAFTAEPVTADEPMAEPVLPEPAAAPAASSPFDDLIPGTRESRDVLPPAEDPGFDLETETRPEGLVQIACLFPEGEEKKAQMFVNKLKEAAARLKKTVTVQPVFLHTWSASSVDLVAISRSASLSGADFIYVLAPRASAAMFASLSSEAAKAGTSGRMVALELLPSPSLYADVLVDLSRKANGPR